MCAIIGCLCEDEEVIDYLLHGLHTSVNRGRDSAGMSTFSASGDIVTTKTIGNDVVTDLHRLSSGHKIGIAHIRWATDGAVTVENAHPHLDMSNRFALAHNGIISNHRELKKKLIGKGVRFSSETDTEVIVQLIGYYARKKNMKGEDAVRKTISQLKGSWGLVIIDKEKPDQIIATANGSPIVIGIGGDRMFIASEISAFSKYTHSYFSLYNGEIAIINPRQFKLDDYQTRIKQIQINEVVESSPTPFPHWTLREIMEQVQSTSRALNNGARLTSDSPILRGLDDNENLLLSIDNLIISACGSSLHAGMYGGKIMQLFGAFHTVNVEDASEITTHSFPLRNGGLLVLSQSGETKDVLNNLDLADDLGIPTFSVINVHQSVIASRTGKGVYINAGKEVGVAATKSFTSQVIVLSLIALWFSSHRENANKQMQRRKSLVKSLQRISPLVDNILSSDQLKKDCLITAQYLLTANHCFILGKGFGEAIAKEAALKLKEITYLPTEGYAAGALKHGPLALLVESMPFILIILEDSNRCAMESTLAQVQSRKAYTIVITDIVDFTAKCDQIILIPSNGILTALLAILPLQLIAYHLAVLKEIDPDNPKNIVKAITVI